MAGARAAFECDWRGVQPAEAPRPQGPTVLDDRPRAGSNELPWVEGCRGEGKDPVMDLVQGAIGGLCFVAADAEAEATISNNVEIMRCVCVYIAVWIIYGR